ncbi:hypothetical protein SKM52_04060 [Acinetobacter faecalis]|uniref:hypothetical protein n=1 Tax=Acinetobacter faecalis TaxID=2665161 RepID=UPI002A919117|nr:hypothetical protein [Acinetobacter faecalis]MDY6523723.1 hypothetical protein [Acinetobacter faecalis]
MEIKELQYVEVIKDVLCDVCGKSTQMNYGELKAEWGYGSTYDGEKYSVQLCEACFFRILRIIKEEKLDSIKSNAKQL